MAIGAVAAAALLALSSGASGFDGDSGWGEDAPRQSVTVSALRLLSAVVQGTYEYRLAPPLAVAGVAGVAVGSPVGLVLGAQGRYYLWGHFERGAYVGASAILATQNLRKAWFYAGEGISLIPFLGGKVVRSGLTFDGQVGLQFWSLGRVTYASFFLDAAVGLTF
jgi:hypothetical protein